MPSTALTGKSKEDLATIAVVSGLLSVEQAGSMTKPELLKFLKKADKASSQPSEPDSAALATAGTGSRKAKAKPDAKPVAKPVAESATESVAKPATRTTAKSTVKKTVKTAAVPSTGPAVETHIETETGNLSEPATAAVFEPVLAAAIEAVPAISAEGAEPAGIITPDSAAPSTTPAIVTAVVKKPGRKPKSAVKTLETAAPATADQPLDQTPAQSRSEQHEQPEPVEHSEQTEQTEQSEPIEQIEKDTRTERPVGQPIVRPARQYGHQPANRPVERIPAAQAGKPGRPATNRPTGRQNAPSAKPGLGQTGRSQPDLSRGKPQQRGPGNAAGKSNVPQQPTRPMRVKVFGIPANPMAAQSEEHESALHAGETEQQLVTAALPQVNPTEQQVKSPDYATRAASRSAARTASPETTQPPAVPESVQPGREPYMDAGSEQLSAAEIEAAAAEREAENDEPSTDKLSRKHIESGESITGVLEIMPDGYGFLRRDNYLQGAKDAYVPPQYIRRFNLRPGDLVTGPCKKQRDNDRYQALLYIKEVNGESPEKMLKRPHFDRLTPVYPNERYILETNRNELSTRIIDLVAPIGKGQRGMIVSPPKAGKTILLQKIANAISTNNPNVKLIVLLIDERPEEVTDMQRSINGEVVYSTFDKTPENHVKVTELVLERAMRLVELKQDVVILLDSMTRLGRAYNLTITPTGRTLSGGLDPGALYGPKRFFGAARNIENGGSLTIIATSLIETGSRMDEVIFEEFKGTGNMEVILDRKLSEKRIFPAIDINRSGTRREELLLSNKELDAVWTIRKAFGQLDTAAVTETIINLLLKTQDNQQFISSINVSFNDKNVFEAMRGQRPTSGNGGNTAPTGPNGPRRNNPGYDRDGD